MRYNSAISNVSCSNTSSSRKKKEKKLEGRCFCGLEVALMEYGTVTNPNRWFIRCPLWKLDGHGYFNFSDKRLQILYVVDEIEEDWEGLARSLAKKNIEHSYAICEDGLTITAVKRENQESFSMIARKMKKLRAKLEQVECSL
ncbi:uncharacterized protein LOC110280494 isoform X2 [Arachis duranensis]|uniref:Uncharacterized protein LOC110280494 isoform X2 n=1 Tax=Arachis duranensis TaxID=130453 RepID=A0A9C6WM63_ARADU|nr:uncharacterized protein LOC110280494 isoform X2 [Arachis duranensis]